MIPSVQSNSVYVMSQMELRFAWRGEHFTGVEFDSLLAPFFTLATSSQRSSDVRDLQTSSNTRTLLIGVLIGNMRKEKQQYPVQAERGSDSPSRKNISRQRNHVLAQ